MPDYTSLETTASFKAATGQAPAAKMNVELDMALVAWFQQQGPDWQEHMNDALRSFMEDIQAMERNAPADPDPAREADRQAAFDALTVRHWQEHDDLAEGRSEEFPSDLAARHAEEWAQLESAHADQSPAKKPAPAAALKPAL